MDFAETSCRLFRRFGDKARPVFLRIEREIAPGSYSWSVVGSEIPAYSSRAKITIVPASGAPVWEFDAQPYVKPGATEAMIQWLDRDGAMARNFADNQQLVIRGPRKLDLPLHLANVKAALKALDACQTDLMESWGLSAALVAKIAKPPEATGNPGRWATNDDYPSDDRQKRNEGTTTFLLNISAEGKITACRTTKSSGFESLDKQTCQLLLQRATFRPAEDAAGKPVESYFILTACGGSFPSRRPKAQRQAGENAALSIF
ncbi:TonB family protein [Sphingopyxis sp. QXT-31]|uniref:TonB family protein n=1 Tax=Sphingopyxis sp. QXT-31 TaxID=1357916 RepID=UPI001E28F9E7|nr:TonB family protein [Sphingopyxis sp. QXT-31]